MEKIMTRLSFVTAVACLAMPPLSDAVAEPPEANPPSKTLSIVLVEATAPENPVKLEMILVPAGEFMMGTRPDTSTPRWDPKAEFYHKVRITHPFYLGKYELTLQQWCMILGKQFAAENAQLPATGISWLEAREFTAKLNERFAQQLPKGMVFRLPTEAEWEYAARAGTTTEYYFGDDPAQLDDYAWYRDNTTSMMQVGQKKPNPWGFFDITGNAWELCLDYFAADHTTTDEVSIDPIRLKPDTLVAAAVRGGSFARQDGLESLRTAAQWGNIWPDKKRVNVGLRLAVGYPMPTPEPPPAHHQD